MKLALRAGSYTSVCGLPSLAKRFQASRSMPWKRRRLMRLSYSSWKKAMAPPSPVVMFLFGWKL